MTIETVAICIAAIALTALAGSPLIYAQRQQQLRRYRKSSMNDASDFR